MVEAGRVETNSGTENAQLIDFSRRTKRQKLEKTRLTGTYLEHSLRPPERVAGRPALSMLRTGLACCCQIVLIKRLPNQGLDYGLAANV